MDGDDDKLKEIGRLVFYLFFRLLRGLNVLIFVKSLVEFLVYGKCY